ncbi:class I SAM-dependent methyltransferase [Salinispira pacifica]
MSDDSERYGYEAFAETEEYLTVNNAIIAKWVDRMRARKSGNLERVLDLATGVGTMIAILLNTLPRRKRPREVVCVDMSEQALQLAERNLKGLVRNLKLVHEPLQNLSVAPESIDAAIWGNGVHYLSAEEQAIACTKVRRTMRKNGWFFLNSAFFEEARPANTLAFYRSQIAGAVRHLRSRGIVRDRNQPHPDSANFLPLSHYRDLLEQAGFKVEELEQVEARLYRSTVEKISAFSQYAAGALHGYPADAATEAMRDAVAPSLEAYGVCDERNERYIPRYWLSAVARAT